MISTKGRYALRVLIDMAEHRGEAFIPLKEIAQRQGISEKYLESIVRHLVQGGILEGLRGKGGGYRLRKNPEDYTVAEVLRMTEGPMAPVSCLSPGADACERAASCRTLSLWQGLDQVVNDYLESVTISDLMLRDDSGNDYVI